jgi:hypothetical protein
MDEKINTIIQKFKERFKKLYESAPYTASIIEKFIIHELKKFNQDETEKTDN